MNLTLQKSYQRKDLAQLIKTGRVKIKWDEFYLEDPTIENDMGF